MKRVVFRRNRKNIVAVGLALIVALAFAGAFAGASGFVIFKPVSVSSSQGDCSFTQDFSAIQCKLGDLKSGASAQVKVVVIPSSEGVLTNTASAWPKEPDRNPGNNTDSVTTRVTAPERVANISVIKKAAPDPARVGRKLVYSLVIRNDGPDNATSVVVTDMLPLNVSLSGIDSSQGSCDYDSNQVRCNLGGINTGKQALVTITVLPTTNGMLLNQACAYGKEFDPDYSRNCDSTTTFVEDAGTDIQVDKSGPSQVNVNEPITYTIVVSNNGPEDATGVVLDDQLR